MDIKVDDDYCSEEVFEDLKKIFVDSFFPWYYHKNKTTNPDDGLYQFVHVFYEINAPTSNWFPNVAKVLESKNPIYVRIKANLQPKSGCMRRSPLVVRIKFFKLDIACSSVLYVSPNTPGWPPRDPDA